MRFLVKAPKVVRFLLFERGIVLDHGSARYLAQSRQILLSHLALREEHETVREPRPTDYVRPFAHLRRYFCHSGTQASCPSGAKLFKLLLLLGG